jgi:hypothetical protein
MERFGYPDFLRATADELGGGSSGRTERTTSQRTDDHGRESLFMRYARAMISAS